MQTQLEFNFEDYKGTITPKKDFDAGQSAEKFRKAISNPGTEGKIFINLLVTHDASQREAIDTRYRSLYGSNLYDDLDRELAGNFRDAVLALMTFPDELLVTALHDAVNGSEVDERTLVEILCLRSSYEIENLDKWYQRRYYRNLDEAILTKLDGDLKDLISALLSTDRESNMVVDNIRARKDAQDLYDAVLASRATSDGGFCELLKFRSYAQLKEIFMEYENIAQEPIEKTVEQNFQESFARGLLAIIQRLKDPLGFDATRLHQCLTQNQNNDKSLIRILVSTSEKSLESIKMRYKELYSTPLWNDIRKYASGDFSKDIRAAAPMCFGSLAILTLQYFLSANLLYDRMGALIAALFVYDPI